jgi:MoaA/NifB/PqqE/SkfB family radical SAM enzyme
MSQMTSAYTSASGDFPYKLLKSKDLILSMLENKRILPLHLQLNPTNKCNLNCSFCSCSERDKELELSFDNIQHLVRKFCDMGCKSVTITGGGEPLMHSRIDEILQYFSDAGVDIGLVTNGFLLPRVTQLEDITWLRVSVSDETRIFKLFDCIDRAFKEEDKIDWSFSYVVSKNPDVGNISKVLAYADEHKFTHVRIVNDILRPLCDLGELRREVLNTGVNDRLAIWQDRQHYSVGTERCLISLLKPVVDARGDIFPCCGAQYASEIPARDYSQSMRMGNIHDIDEIWENQKCFNGSDCVKCYYEHYNVALRSIIDDIEHVNFV